MVGSDSVPNGTFTYGYDRVASGQVVSLCPALTTTPCTYPTQYYLHRAYDFNGTG